MGGNPSVLRHGEFVLDEMSVVSHRVYIFEKMSLVASQLPLTREPRKECGARGRGDFAWVVSVELFGATGGASSSPTKNRIE